METKVIENGDQEMEKCVPGVPKEVNHGNNSADEQQRTFSFLLTGGNVLKEKAMHASGENS